MVVMTQKQDGAGSVEETIDFINTVSVMLAAESGPGQAGDGRHGALIERTGTGNNQNPLEDVYQGIFVHDNISYVTQEEYG
jgi:hypothetical protein